MWLLFRIFCFFAGVLRLGFRSKAKTFDLKTQNGTPYRLQEERHKGRVVRRTLQMASDSKLPFLRVQGESFLSRALKALGLTREFQTGNPEFDEQFFVATDNHSLIESIRCNPKFMQALLELRQRGWVSLQCRHFGQRVTLKGSENSDTSESTLSLMDEVVATLNQSSVAHSPLDSTEIKILLFEGCAYGIIAYCMGAYLHWVVVDADQLIDPFYLLFKGVLVGAGILAFWLVLASFLFRQSSRLVPLFADLLLIFSVCAVFSGPQLIIDLNQGLDRSPIEIVRSQILDKQSVTTGSGKNRRTNFFLHLASEPNRFRLPKTLRISTWDFWKFQRNQVIELRIRSGFFDAPYIDSMELSENSSLIIAAQPRGTPGSDLSLERKKQLMRVAKWRAEPPPSNTAEASVIEVRYDSGKLRSREPVLNGKIHGLGQYWHPNGQLYAEIPWLNGHKHGRFVLYREDGSRDSELSYQNGQPHGLLSWYNKSGVLIERYIYIDGEQVRLRRETVDQLVSAER